MHQELYDVASCIGGISVKLRRLDNGTAETDIAMPSWVINTLVKRVVRAMRGKPKSGASQGSDKDIPIVPIEAGSDPQGRLWVTLGVYLWAGKPPLADIILSHPPDLT